MGAARRLVRSRLATLVVCAGGVLLFLPSAGLAAGWTSSGPVAGQDGVTSVATGLDGSSNLIAVWAATGVGIEASVRSATTTAWSAPVVLSGSDTTASAPDVAVSVDGKAVATWTGSSGSIWASVRMSTSWAGPSKLSGATTQASSAQAAIVGGIPSAFWIDGTVVEHVSATAGGLWGNTAASPAGSPSDPGVISGLRVALASDGSGIAAWLRTEGNTVTVETAVIGANGTWTPSTTLSSTADASSTVAVADGFGTSAVAWSEPTAGVQVALFDGANFSVESGATVGGATDPSLAVDPAGQVYATVLVGSALSVEVRDTSPAWASPTALASGAIATSASSDAAGDVIVAWPTASDVQMRVFDVSKPVLVLTTPGSPLPPGDHTWSVTSSDVWSDAPATTADWTFSPGATHQNTATVTDSEQIPGPVSATVTVTDSANNTATAQATITIQPVAPQNTQIAMIGGGSAPVDGGILTVGTPGVWKGNPTPVVTSSWQRCSTGQACTTVTGNPDGSYTLTAADVGFRIRIEESANNTGGTVLGHSAETPVVKPISTVAPKLTASDSTLADGVLLTASPGSWNSAGNLAFSYAFFSCDVTCTPIPNGGLDTYTPGPDVVGTNIEVRVTATAGPVDGLTAQLTATSAQVGVVAPHSSAAPGLTGGTQDTQTLTATSPASSWNGATGLDPLTYIFSRCDADGSPCAELQNGPAATYKLGKDDIGSRVEVAVAATATDNAGHHSARITSAPSSLSAVITPHIKTGTGVAAPVPTAPATLVKDGVTLVANPGTWDDPDALTFSYQYYHCISPPGNCTAVGSASLSPSYLLQPTDVGLAMLVIVTATADGASTSVTSGATVPVQPMNDGSATITPPTVQQDTQTFTSSDASWHGATGLTLAYQWKRCDVADVCAAIPGATSKNYTAVVADVGNTLRVTVSASKGGSAVTPSLADSSPTAAIAPFPTTAPTIAGASTDTKPLTATDGAWDGATNLTETYQFSRCDADGNNCNAVQNTDSNVYTLGLADIGSRIQVVVFAKKNSSAAIASAGSTVTSIITPLSSAAPAAPTGTTQDGQLLTALDGTWQHQAGLSFRYQWYRCSPTCTPIVGSVSKTYKLQPADVGTKVYADTTAFVGAGAATTASPQTLAVAPLSTGAASVSTPTAQDGQLFSASTGDWNGAVGLTFAYQWRRCDAAGANCTSILNTSGTYTAAAADVGFTLEATVSASKGGSATTPSAYSQPSAVVAARNTVRPTITGDPTDGQTLTTPASTNAAWNNTPATLSFAYQWLRCDSAGANCAAIDGATTPAYKLTADDVTAATDATHARHKLEVQVTATVNGVTTPITSDVSPVIAAQTTVVTTLPSVTGGAFSNQALLVQAGSWSGTGVSYQDYQWVRCDPPLATPTCTNLGPASITATGYTVQAADVGHYVTVIESVVNRLGETKSVRAAFGVPVLQNQFGIVSGGDPVVSGSYVDGQTLTTTSGTWNQADGVIFSYSWLRCAPNPNGSAPGGSQTCPSIPHANTASYTLTPDDVGKYIVSHVKGVYPPASANAIFDSEIEGRPAVSAAPPVLTVRPTISGVARQDVVLTASTGTWSGTNTAAVPMSFAYQWNRCNTDGTTCQPIAGATSAAYTASATDVGLRLLVKVTATNSGGSKSTVSDATDVVATSAVAAPPGAGAAPAGSGSGAGGPGIGAASTKTDKTAPRLTLAFLGKGTLLSGTTLQLDATCPVTEKSCKAKFQLLAVLKKPTGKAVAKPVVIASASTTLQGGQKKRLKLKLSAAARAALKRSLKLKVTLTANVVDAAGNVTPKETKGITLRWKKA